MTLILTLGNSDQVIQISDRRLSRQGELVDDESNKAGVLVCSNARLAFGFTGIAETASKDFITRDWLLEALNDALSSCTDALGILRRLRNSASNLFQQHLSLRHLTPKDQILSVMFSGYLDHHFPLELAVQSSRTMRPSRVARWTPKSWAVSGFLLEYGGKRLATRQLVLSASGIGGLWLRAMRVCCEPCWPRESLHRQSSALPRSSFARWRIVRPRPTPSENSCLLSASPATGGFRLKRNTPSTLTATRATYRTWSA